MNKIITIGGKNYTIKTAPAVYVRKILIYLLSSLNELGADFSKIEIDEKEQWDKIQGSIKGATLQDLESQAFDAFDAIIEEANIHFLTTNKKHKIIDLNIAEIIQWLEITGELTIEMGKKVIAEQQQTKPKPKGFQPLTNPNDESETVRQLRNQLSKAKKQLEELTITDEV